MLKRILLTILFMANVIHCAQCKQQQPKNYHYELQYHALHTTRPGNPFVEPIISCIINPSSMEIKHGELYQINQNPKPRNNVTSTISLTFRQYEYITLYVRSKKYFYIEAHNPNKSLRRLFEMNPNRIEIKK